MSNDPPPPVWPDPSPHDKRVAWLLAAVGIAVLIFAGAAFTGQLGRDTGRDTDRSSISKFESKPEPKTAATKSKSKSKARSKRAAAAPGESRLVLVTGATGPVRGMAATSHAGSSVEITRNRKSTISTTVYLALFGLALMMFVLVALGGRIKTLKLSKDGFEAGLFSPEELAQVAAAKQSKKSQRTTETLALEAPPGTDVSATELPVVAAANANQILLDFIAARGRNPDPVERQQIMNRAIDDVVAPTDDNPGPSGSKAYRFDL